MIVKYAVGMMLACMAASWSSLESAQGLDEVTRLRMALSQEARALRFKEVFPGEVSYIEGTDGFCVQLPADAQSLFPRLSILEKERLLMAFYLAEEPPLTTAQETAVGAKVRAAKKVAAEEEGSLVCLARVREEIPHRELLEEYFRLCLNVNDIAKRIVLVTSVFSRVNKHFPELSKQDRWFLRAHLFCMPWDKDGKINPLEDFAKDPSKLDELAKWSLADVKAFLAAKATEATQLFLSE